MGFYSEQTLSYTNEDAELDRRDGPPVLTLALRTPVVQVACVTCGDDGDCPDCDWAVLARQYARSYQISFYAAQADITRRRGLNGDSEAARWFRRVLAGEKIAWSTTA